MANLHITIERDALVKALAISNRFVERNSRLPILANALILADSSGATLIGTNLDQRMAARLDCAIVERGAVAVPAHTLAKLAATLPLGPVMLNGENGTLTVSSGEARFVLETRSAEDFPAPMELGAIAASFELPAADLRDMLAKTKLAVSTEETRFYLNGVLFETDARAGELLAVATDGHKLARLAVPLPARAEGLRENTIVPRQACFELLTLLKREKAPVRICATGNRIRFETAAWTLITELIDGTFPDWRRVVPRRDGALLQMDSAAFQGALARVRASIPDPRTQVGVKLTLAPGSLIVSRGETSEKLAATWVGGPLEIGFDVNFLLELAKQIEGSWQMRLTDAGSPARIESLSDPRLLYVLMPRRYDQ